MSRRAQLAKQIRAKKQRDATPLLLAIPWWAVGAEPVLIIHAGGRAPTADERLQFEITTLREWAEAAKWYRMTPEERAAVIAARPPQPSTQSKSTRRHRAATRRTQ